MRVSADPDDPDYLPLPGSAGLKILLDGVEQSPTRTGRAILSADDVAGEIVYYEHEGRYDGHLRFRTVNGELKRFTARGKVQIIAMDVELREALETLADFRQFILDNMTQCQRGAGATNPMWARVASLLDKYAMNGNDLSGPHAARYHVWNPAYNCRENED